MKLNKKTTTEELNKNDNEVLIFILGDIINMMYVLYNSKKPEEFYKRIQIIKKILCMFNILEYSLDKCIEKDMILITDNFYQNTLYAINNIYYTSEQYQKIIEIIKSLTDIKEVLKKKEIKQKLNINSRS
ncbi:hypothetical protein [Rickettsia endosymbiont of Cardiosporidium cionae]|uniref:hypothetical protein n=1 Tax=Rickettsia endosymbiont of Cardiosporidium cionae TaxID=2777155 RepID=UPI0018935F99|nr:hypothetical protein [Rickettsia endosymbiont of Cardiosporidium cionae]KAF8818877.1 hypothetical protein IHI24_000111 [Rickettsia endosymbiont of Cardiosporidium cionae]